MKRNSTNRIRQRLLCVSTFHVRSCERTSTLCPLMQFDTQKCRDCRKRGGNASPRTSFLLCVNAAAVIHAVVCTHKKSVPFEVGFTAPSSDPCALAHTHTHTCACTLLCSAFASFSFVPPFCCFIVAFVLKMIK